MNKNVKLHLLAIALLLTDHMHGADQPKKTPTPETASDKAAAQSYWTWENGK